MKQIIHKILVLLKLRRPALTECKEIINRLMGDEEFVQMLQEINEDINMNDEIESIRYLIDDTDGPCDRCIVQI